MILISCLTLISVYGPPPELVIDGQEGHGTWLCSGEVISRDDPTIRRWISSGGLKVLGTELDSLLGGRQVAGLACSSHKLFDGRTTIARPEELTNTCFPTGFPTDNKEHLTQSRMRLAARDIHDDIIRKLPKSSFEAIPDTKSLTVEDFPSVVGDVPDHPYQSYKFDLRAVNRHLFARTFQKHHTARQVLHVDPNLPAISIEYSKRDQCWDLTYFASSLFERAKGAFYVPPYGVIDYGDQRRMAGEIMSAFDGASSRRILPMLTSSSQQSLLKFLQNKHGHALGYVTKGIGSELSLETCNAAKGKQAGSFSISCPVVHLDDGTKVRLGVKMIPSIGYFQSHWETIGLARLSRSESGTTIFSTSAKVVRIYTNVFQQSEQVTGTVLNLSHNFVKGLVTRLAQEYRFRDQSDSLDSIVLNLSKVQQTYTSAHFKPEFEGDPSKAPQSTFSVINQSEEETGFIVNFAPPSGMEMPLPTEFKKTMDRLHLMDRSMQRMAMYENKKPCNAIRSILKDPWGHEYGPDEI